MQAYSVALTFVALSTNRRGGTKTSPQTGFGRPCHLAKVTCWFPRTAERTGLPSRCRSRPCLTGAPQASERMWLCPIRAPGLRCAWSVTAYPRAGVEGYCREVSDEDRRTAIVAERLSESVPPSSIRAAARSTQPLALEASGLTHLHPRSHSQDRPYRVFSVFVPAAISWLPVRR